MTNILLTDEQMTTKGVVRVNIEYAFDTTLAIGDRVDVQLTENEVLTDYDSGVVTGVTSTQISVILAGKNFPVSISIEDIVSGKSTITPTEEANVLV